MKYWFKSKPGEMLRIWIKLIIQTNLLFQKRIKGLKAPNDCSFVYRRLVKAEIKMKHYSRVNLGLSCRKIKILKPNQKHGVVQDSGFSSRPIINASTRVGKCRTLNIRQRSGYACAYFQFVVGMAHK